MIYETKEPTPLISVTMFLLRKKVIHERQEEVLELMPAGEAEQENQEVLFSTLIIWHESKFSGHFFPLFYLETFDHSL